MYFSEHSPLIIDALSSWTGDVYLFVCLCILAISGHHGDLLNQGLLNDMSGQQQCLLQLSHIDKSTHTYRFLYTSEDFILTVY